MPRIQLLVQSDHPQAPLVRHLLREYGAWYGVEWVENTRAPGLPLLVWGDVPAASASAAPELPSVRIPPRPPAPLGVLRPPLVAADLSWITVPAAPYPLPLPAPPSGASPLPQGPRWELPCDVLLFLADLLWRREELEEESLDAACEGRSSGLPSCALGLMNAPWADLWMLSLLDHLLPGFAAQVRARPPHFWMTHDIDCLRKWKPRSLLHHLTLFVSYAVALSTHRWLRLLGEALASRNPRRDPWYTVPRMWECDADLRADFFFLGHPRDHITERYDLRQSAYAELAQGSLSLGHGVGLHGSPLHAENLPGLQAEKAVVEAACGSAVQVCRQHYLRCVPGATLTLLDQAGFALDSSLGLNDRPGFRCATCVPLRWWDFETHQPLALRELPFIAGDWTLHNPAEFDAPSSLARLQALGEQVRHAGGVFGLIFHELYFADEYTGHAQFYRDVLGELRKAGWVSWNSAEYLRRVGAKSL